MQALPRTARSAALRQAATRSYSSAASPYSQTVQNLRINDNTKVIFQGFTGKQGTYVLCPIGLLSILSFPRR
jgi:succinyl-CoA synthetase alpha subunit